MICEFCNRQFTPVNGGTRPQRFCNLHCSAMSRRQTPTETPDPVIKDIRLFVPTDAPPGSSEKVAVLARRVEIGAPLFHPADRVDFAGLRSVRDE